MLKFDAFYLFMYDLREVSSQNTQVLDVFPVHTETLLSKQSIPAGAKELSK
jgi:hypothetical protein